MGAVRKRLVEILHHVSSYTEFMRFALIGEHPDGWAMAEALARSEGFTFIAYAGPAGRRRELQEAGWDPEFIPEVEELLARPDIDLVIVADVPGFRPAVLRRAVQSEKHILCVHPVEEKADISYEAAMIQRDTRKLLMPLLTEGAAPPVLELAALIRDGQLGRVQVIELERPLPAPAGKTGWDGHPLLTLWEPLRRLGSEVVELSATGARGDQLSPDDEISVSGKLTSGAMFRVLLTPATTTPNFRLLVRGEKGEAEWSGSEGLHGAGTWHRRTGEDQAPRALPAELPWPRMADAVRAGLAGQGVQPSWTDGIRCLEIFDAVRESVQRQRAIPLLYQDFTETGTFKGLMTTTGCGLVWLMILVVFTSPFWPKILWLIPILVVVFLGLQLFRWAVPEEAEPGRDKVTR